MKKLIILLLLIILTAGLTGCKKSVLHSENEIAIEFGTECGWCAGEKFIVVSPAKIKYERTIPCGDNQGTETKSISITTEKWDSIWSSFNYNLFKTLDYNACNVCADGCDEIIRITKAGNTHEIRYTPGEDIEGIEDLRHLLAEILSDFNEQD